MQLLASLNHGQTIDDVWPSFSPRLSMKFPCSFTRELDLKNHRLYVSVICVIPSQR